MQNEARHVNIPAVMTLKVKVNILKHIERGPALQSF